MSSVVKMYGMNELPDERDATLTVNWIDKKQNIGIEIEVEMDGETSINRDDLNYWTVKSDGSLRHGQEFVLSRPLRGDTLSAAIEEFFRDNRVFRSPTSGTHVHVDMRDKASTLDVVKTMASIMTCIEPSIFGMFTEGREWCGYTNLLTTLPETASFPLFSDTATDSDFVRAFAPQTREFKYYGFNMLPLGRYGSLEFRYFNTAENAEELIDWVQFCMAVKLAAVSIGSRAGFKYYLASEVYWEEFLNKFFAQWRDQMMPFLPYKEVYTRYKQARGRALKKAGPKNKVARGAAGTHKLRDTRYKKFFAMKVKDNEGKQKLVYDMAGVTQFQPARIFCATDAIPLTRMLRDSDFLITDSVFYKFSTEMGRWIEYVYVERRREFRIIDSYRALTEIEMLALYRAVEGRFAGTSTEESYNDMNHPSYAEELVAIKKSLISIVKYHLDNYNTSYSIPATSWLGEIRSSRELEDEDAADMPPPPEVSPRTPTSPQPGRVRSVREQIEALHRGESMASAELEQLLDSGNDVASSS